MNMRPVLVLVSLAGSLVAGCSAWVTLGDLPLDGSAGDASPDTVSTPDAAVATDSGKDAAKPPYLACAGKICGSECTVCAPGDATCLETAVVKICDPAGICRAGSSNCTGAGGTPVYNPCEGKACGSSCSLCPPFDPMCVEPAVLNNCNKAGACTASASGC